MICYFCCLPFNVLFELFRGAAAPGAVEEGDKKEDEDEDAAHHGAHQRLVGQQLAHGDADGVELHAVRVLQVQLIVPRVGLVRGGDHEGGHVAVLALRRGLLEHGEPLVGALAAEEEAVALTGASQVPVQLGQGVGAELHAHLRGAALGRKDIVHSDHLIISVLLETFAKFEVL